MCFWISRAKGMVNRDIISTGKIVTIVNHKKAWNGKMISEPILNPKKEKDLNCLSSVLWGNEQSELLKKRQIELIKRENWTTNGT